MIFDFIPGEQIHETSSINHSKEPPLMWKQVIENNLWPPSSKGSLMLLVMSNLRKQNFSSVPNTQKEQKT